MCIYFNYYEFIKSDKAEKLGIDNEPKDDDTIDNIIELMRVMDKIRAKWTVYVRENCLGSPAIVINSGYRCNDLNEAVKGAKTSAHKIGSACDFEAVNGQNKALFEIALEVLVEENIEFEEIINEHNYAWIHLALQNQWGERKKEIIGYEGKGI